MSLPSPPSSQARRLALLNEPLVSFEAVLAVDDDGEGLSWTDEDAVEAVESSLCGGKRGALPVAAAAKFSVCSRG